MAFVYLRHRIIEYELDSFVSSNGSRNLIYLERESFARLRCEIVQLLDTRTGQQLSGEEARSSQLLKVISSGSIVFDTARSSWVTAGEAITRGILRVNSSSSPREVNDRVQKTITVFQVAGIRPGGSRSSNWLKPVVAEQRGVFNWQTGEVVDLKQSSTRWYNFMDAQKAGWVQLTPGCNISCWKSLVQSDFAGRYLLEDDITLVEPFIEES